MLLNSDKQSEVLSSGDNTIDMGIDKADTGILMMILSKNLYSDGIGSLIRELTTNALDSHIEAGNTEPIIVSLKREDGNYVFSVQDFGVGLSPERVENIYSKYAASTKRTSDTQYGAFGLGSKTPLAYRDNFIIISRHDGVEYKYMMFKGEDGTKLSLLHMAETDKANGVTIKVQLKSDNDKHEFLEKIQQQLCYFDGVFFDVEGIDNNFKIVKHKDWKYSEICVDYLMHICLDNVYYPLDYKELGIPQINVPVGINFTVKDGIMPTPNRESIIYTPTVKKMINERIGLIADWFITEWNKSADASTLAEAKRLSQLYGVVSISTDPDIQINGSALEKYSSIQSKGITMSKYPHLNIKALWDKTSLFYTDYYISSMILNGRHRTKDLDYQRISADNKVYVIDQKPPTKVIVDYLKDTVGNCLFVYRKKRKLGYPIKFTQDRSDYVNVLGLRKDNKAEWRTMIKEFEQLLNDEYKSNFKMLSTVKPNAQWLIDRKAGRTIGSKTLISREEIHIKMGREADIYRTNIQAVYDKKSVHFIDSLHKMPGLFIYGLEDSDKARLDNYFRIGRSAIDAGSKRGKIFTVMLSKRDYDKLNKFNIHNWININDVSKKAPKYIAKYATALVIYQFLKKHASITNEHKFISAFAPKFQREIQELQKYSTDIFNGRQPSTTAEFDRELLSMAGKNNWWDKEIWHVYNNLKKEIKSLNFVGYLKGSAYQALHNSPGALELAKEIYFNRKLKNVKQ